MLELEHRHDATTEVVEAVAALCERLRRRLSRTVRIRRKVGKAVEQVSKLEIGFDDVRLSFDPTADDHDIELAELIYATVSAVVGHGRHGVILMFDEAQVLENPASLSVLVAAVSALQRNAVPVGLVLCGLAQPGRPPPPCPHLHRAHVPRRERRIARPRRRPPGV